MKKIFSKITISLTVLAMLGMAAAMPANAEVIQSSTDADTTFFINVTPEECDEYALFPNVFSIDPSDPDDSNGSRAFFADPTAKMCLEYNIYPNKYDIIPPHHVTGNLITENNGYYKYMSDKAYENGTLEVTPGVYPCEKGVCYDVVKRVGDELYYLTLPLDAEDITAAEGFISSDDREGLYDFLAEKNSYIHPDFGEVNDFTSVVNRDYTPVNENSIWAVNGATPDEIYQDIIDIYVYPSFQLPPTATGAAAGSITELDYNLIVGDVNVDDKISISDLIAINKMNIGVVVPSNTIQRYLADVDGSKVIDSSDVTLMMQFMLDIIDVLPASES